MSPGEKKAWKDLRGLEPENVCSITGADFDSKTGRYSFSSFGLDIAASPEDETFSGDSEGGETLLQRFGYFSKLSFIWYLAAMKDIPLSGELVKPLNLKGGEIFFRGSHVLPLEQLAEKYSNDAYAFLKKGAELGAEVLDHGDAAIKLYPLPKFPVVLILWVEDDEFPARLDLLFDSSAELQLPLDIIWSIAMLSLLIMM